MKKFLIALVCVFGAGLSFNSFAQEPNAAEKTSIKCIEKQCKEKCTDDDACAKWKEGKRKGGKHGCKKGNPMMKGIDLNADQQVKAEKASKSFKERVAKIKERVREEREKAVAEYDSDMKEILTPEQYAQFEKNRVNHAKIAKEGKKDKKGGKKHNFKNGDKRKKDYRTMDSKGEKDAK